MPVTPSRALRRAAASGTPLPAVPALSGLARWGVEPRFGQLVMVTGRPKAGKSNLLQALVEAWKQPTLYHCWDMPPMTAISRQAAALTAHRVQDILHEFDNDTPAAGFYEDALEESCVKFSFDRKPSIPDIEAEIDAWVETYDAFPKVQVFDNLINIEGAEEGHEALVYFLGELQALAFDTGSLCVVLHHAKEGHVTDPSKPPKAKDTAGLVNQKPDLVLSVANDGRGSLYASPVAARNGRTDPNAENPVKIPFDLGTLQFAYPSTNAWSPA